VAAVADEGGWTRERRALGVLLAVLVMLGWPAAATAAPYTEADYFRFADGIAAAVDPTWDAGRGYYDSGTRAVDSRYNAALLVVHATAAARGHAGPARNDARARRIAERLTEAPPFHTGTAPPWPDPMFHTPGWLGNLDGDYTVMDKAIDPKIAEGLEAAWSARAALGLPAATAARIADQISGVASGPFFRFPNVRLNQINWPVELYAYEARVTGTPELLVSDYMPQVSRFVAGVRSPWGGRTGATNLSPTYRFHYQINERASARRNVDSAEYANMTLQFLAFYDDALAAGAAPLPERDLRVLRGWVQRDLFGYWMHSGFMSWDTGLGFRRWMKGKTWAYALQGLLTIVEAPEFSNDPRYGPWAKTIFDRALDFYGRQPRGADGLVDSALFGINGAVPIVPDTRMFAARMAASAARAVTSGLGSLPAAEPPPFYAFDPDVGRLSISTPLYSTAIMAVNRAAFPYGGIELARYFDAAGNPVGGVGARPPAAFGVQVRDRHGRQVLATAKGFHATPARPPLVVRSPAGRIARVPAGRTAALAGPFRTLDAVGRRRTRDLEVTTRHHFAPAAITEAWTVRRRAGKRRFRVGVLFPSWGATAAIDAEMKDGSVVPLAGAGAPLWRVPLARVRRFHIRSSGGGYWVRALGDPRGVAEGIAVAPQRSAPTPGPTLRLTLRTKPSFRLVTLRARIIPEPG
jgi:hypothetical protein